MTEQPDKPIPEGCDTCPNRGKPESERTIGKWGAYIFALIVSLFLASACVSADRRNETVPMPIWMPCLLLIGTALGVQIDPESVGKFLGAAKNE